MVTISNQTKILNFDDFYLYGGEVLKLQKPPADPKGAEHNGTWIELLKWPPRFQRGTALCLKVEKIT